MRPSNSSNSGISHAVPSNSSSTLAILAPPPKPPQLSTIKPETKTELHIDPKLADVILFCFLSFLSFLVNLFFFTFGTEIFI